MYGSALTGSGAAVGANAALAALSVRASRRAVGPPPPAWSGALLAAEAD